MNRLPPFVRFKSSLDSTNFILFSGDDAIFTDTHPHTDTHTDMMQYLFRLVFFRCLVIHNEISKRFLDRSNI
jgi:hypothetical protein